MPLLLVAVLLVSIPILGKAADMFVTAASRVSLRYRVSPVVVGAVVIGFGTSLPEALTSVLAAVDGSIDVAVGNIIGSNAANLTLVLGPAALLCAITFPPPILRREVMLLIASTALFTILIFDKDLSRFDGLILTSALALAVYSMARSATRGDAELEREVVEYAESEPGESTVWLRLIGGAVGVVVGAYVLLFAATNLASYAGLSGGFVGVSIVAIGTSLPEMVTSYHAARRKEGELIVGNLLGSNVFNALFVGGASALVGPGPVSEQLAHPAAWVMCAVTLVVATAAFAFRRLPRSAAPVLLLAYIAVLFIAA